MLRQKFIDIKKYKFESLFIISALEIVNYDNDQNNIDISIRHKYT